MNLFDAVNFLPDEARFGDKLLEYYEVFDLSVYDDFDSSKSFESEAKRLLCNDVTYTTSETGQSWKRTAFYNDESDKFSELYPKVEKNVFTVSSLKSRFKGKWFNQHKHYLSNRLRKLYDEGVLIKFGQNLSNENVYALNNNNGSKISEKLPSFDDTSKINQFKESVFDLVFPNCSDDWDKFIEYDEAKPLEKSLTESVEALYNLPYIKEANDVFPNT
jgi:hypothetical protein